MTASQSTSSSVFRVLPYLQVYDSGRFQLSWITNDASVANLELYDDQGNLILSESTSPSLMPEIFYTSVERSESIAGLTQGSWLLADQAYKHQIIFPELTPGSVYTYLVRISGTNYSSSFRSAPDKNNWQKLRFVALSDSETEPEGRVVRRAWYPGDPAGFRPSSSTSLWKDRFGTTNDNGFEILNYPLSEEKGYQENLKIINNRIPEFLLMPGDLVQGGGYQPAWDEFFRQNAGELGKGLGFYPIIPALGNWENFGAINGGYGFNSSGDYLPKLGRERFQAYFETSSTDDLQKHRQSYYRVDYGPVTILTLDSSNGTPEAKRSDTPTASKLKNQEYNGPGTDTQENFTQAEYESAGGTDLSSFGPGSDQYIWLEENLASAKESGQLIFVQFHHMPYSSGEHGVPMNHELSTGQGGTPLRVLHPLFEEAGVVAVLAGHDELFERSFVDEDNDGTGVYYFDVGVAGDGLRGEKRNLLQDPTQLLNYNSFKQWTADQNSPEQWDQSGTNPILTDGGKHYGHLEVNLERVSEGNDTFAKVKFSPVYAFPVLDQNYNLVRVERRVYDAEVELKILLETSDFIPEFRDSVAIYLDRGQSDNLGFFPPVFDAKATLSPEDFLVEMPEEEFEFNSAKGFEFDCSDLGSNEFQVSAQNIRTGEIWVSDLKLYVLDTIAPVFTLTSGFLEFDPLESSPASIGVFGFDPIVDYDNCTLFYDYDLSIEEITCDDIGWRDEEKLFEVSGVAIDQSGNRSDPYVTTLRVVFAPSDTISIAAQGPLYEGNSTELKLGEEYEYDVLSWYGPDGLIPGAKGKSLLIEKEGTYFAEIVTQTGCPLITDRIFVQSEEVPFPPLKDEIIVELGEDGIANITAEELFESWPPEDESLTFELSQSEFDCAQIGEQEIKVIISDSVGTSWELDVIVLVSDLLAPDFIEKFTPVPYEFDLSVGELTLNPEDFFTELPTDNCGDSGVTITMSQTVITCADVDSERETYPVFFEISVSDDFGNSRSFQAAANLNLVESVKVSLKSDGMLFAGKTVTLELGNELEYDVIEWRRSPELIPDENEKTLVVSEPGIYAAVLMLSNGCLVASESIEITESDVPFPPVVDLVELELDENGVAILEPENVFTSWPPADLDLEITFSKSEFGCEDVGENQNIVIRIEGQSGEVWERLTVVSVRDTAPPVLILKDLEVEFDLVLGEVTLSAEDFIEEISDNCEVLEVTLNQSVYTCEDLGEAIEIEIVATDKSGNETVEKVSLTLIPSTSRPVQISGNVNLCAGDEAEIVLESDADFEVIRWRRNGDEVSEERDKTLITSTPGVYHAVIRYAGGCIAETEEIEVSVQQLPEGEIEEDGNVLRAPEGDFTYQWFRNGESISGSVSRTLTVDQMGEYTVDLTTSFGCTTRLEPVVLTISGIISRPVVQPESLKIFPNPAESLVEVTIESDPAFSLVSLQIYTQEGRDITSSVRMAQKSNVDFELNLESLPQGMYLIWIRGAGQKLYFGKLVKH